MTLSGVQPYAVTDIGHWTLGLVLFYCYCIVLINHLLNMHEFLDSGSEFTLKS